MGRVNDEYKADDPKIISGNVNVQTTIFHFFLLTDNLTTNHPTLVTMNNKQGNGFLFWNYYKKKLIISRKKPYHVINIEH